MNASTGAITRTRRTSRLPPDVSPAGAAAIARTVLVELYPQHRGTLDTARATALAKIPDGPAKTDGIALGHAAAKAMLARWLHDQMNAKAPFTPRNGPGAFQLPGNASPIGTGWGAVTPFTLGNMEEFRFPGPPPLTSERYARDFAEVNRHAPAWSGTQQGRRRQACPRRRGPERSPKTSEFFGTFRHSGIACPNGGAREESS
jgi:hypothetical protein